MFELERASSSSGDPSSRVTADQQSMRPATAGSGGSERELHFFLPSRLVHVLMMLLEDEDDYDCNYD